MRRVLLLALALAMTGCARPGAARCDEPFPLVVQAYPSVANASLVEVQTTFWNCTSEPHALDDPCGARNGLMPIVAIADEWHYLGLFGPHAAVPREHVDCVVSEFDPPARSVAEPGFYGEQRYLWDGTVRPEGGAAVHVPPGAYTFFLRIGPFYDSATIEVPLVR